MSRILAFLLVVCAATTLALPLDDRQAAKGILLVRLGRSANPGFGHHGGHYGGYHGGYHGGYYGGHDGGYGGGHGGYDGGHGGYGGGGTFAQSSSNSAAINTPFGSAAFSNSNSNAGGYGR